MARTLSISADQLSDAVKVFYKSKQTPLFVGKPGIGKTAMVRQAAAELSTECGEYVHVREVHLASMSEVDVRGYLVPDGDTCHFTKPEFWSDVEKHKRGILFYDEMLQAPPEVQKAVAPTIYERRIGENYLPEGWTVACAGNGLDDGAGANSLLSHVLNRLTLINVTAPDVDRWVLWAISAKLPPELITFGKMRPNIVFDSDIPEVFNTPYCTPRSLDMLGKNSDAYPGGLRAMINDTLGMAIMSGNIGEGPSVELAAFVKETIQLPSYEDVIKDPLTTMIPDERSQAYAMVMLCAVRAKLEHKEQLISYLCRFKPNDALTGIVSIMRRDPEFIATKRMAKWLDENKELIGKFRGYISKAGA